MSEDSSTNADLTASPNTETEQTSPGRLSRIRAFERQVSTTWHAPLPPPDLLRDYNQAFPGCAERIVSMAEAESKERYEANRHQRESLRRIIDGDVYSQKTGLWLAFLLALFVIAIGAFLIDTGKLAWGAGLISLPLVALVSLFIYGRSSQARDLRKADSADLGEEDAEQAELPFPE